jgi:TusE/DsrC/DsvC family sulfur relay protein
MYADINPHTLNPVRTRTIAVNGRPVVVDLEGYLMDLDDWSEDFARALAREEGLELTDEHWQVIGFIRRFHEEHRVQPQVRYMIKHFAALWGPEKGNNHYLHEIFPKGGPQKQGNRLAGIRRTRGEH